MRLLIVEDNAYVAAIIIREVTEAGHRVVRHARTARECEKFAQKCECDAAVLDMDLLGASAERIQTILVSRGVSFLLLSARPGSVIRPNSIVPIVAKPLKMDKLLKELSNVAHVRASQAKPPPARNEERASDGGATVAR